MKIVRNILAIIVGWAAGAFINSGLVMLGYGIYPIEGIDPNDMEALAAAMPNLGAEHLIFPFLAHAVGTLVGAFVTGLIAATHKMKFALAIGVLNLIGGIVACFMIPAPGLFMAVDLILAYIPMAWIGGMMAVKMTRAPQA